MSPLDLQFSAHVEPEGSKKSAAQFFLIIVHRGC